MSSTEADKIRFKNDAPIYALFPETIACVNCGEAAHPWHQDYFGQTVYRCKWCKHVSGWNPVDLNMKKSLPDDGGYPQNLERDDYEVRGWAWPWNSAMASQGSGRMTVVSIGGRYRFHNRDAGEYGREGQSCTVTERQEYSKMSGQLYLVRFDDGQDMQVCEEELHPEPHLRA